jgi:hypothetical protein
VDNRTTEHSREKAIIKLAVYEAQNKNQAAKKAKKIQKA